MFSAHGKITDNNVASKVLTEIIWKCQTSKIWLAGITIAATSSLHEIKSYEEQVSKKSIINYEQIFCNKHTKFYNFVHVSVLLNLTYHISLVHSLNKYQLSVFWCGLQSALEVNLEISMSSKIRTIVFNEHVVIGDRCLLSIQ